MSYRRLYLYLCPFFQFQFLFSSCIPSFKQCGCSREQPIFSQSRIVGGSIARAHSWPWIVSIRNMDNDHDIAFCGGSLINEKYVLTAAHCLYDINPLFISNYYVVIASQYINDTNPIRLKIKSILLHEEYNDESYVNDIALLELINKVDLNNAKIGFICLPQNNIPIYPYEQMNGIAAGWGQLRENGSMSYTLQQVQLPIISNTNASCMKQISDDHVQFCAGFIQGGRDTCQGDSGGPLMIFNEISSTWNIAGITSYGHGCARADNPGVYTRVSMFVDWIKNHVNYASHASIRQISNGIFLLLFCNFLYF